MKKSDALSQPCEFADFNLESRVHPLKSFGKNLYIKRDDELSFLSNGSKLRKYATLLPFLKKLQPPLVILKGSALSNHIVGFTPLLREWEIPARLFLKRTESEGTVQMRLLQTFESDITWVEREEWYQVDQMIEEQYPNAFIVPVGGDHPASLPGAMTLASDILRNEEQEGITFDTVIVDSGTGHQAVAIILGLALLKQQKRVEVLLVAGSEKEFEVKLDQTKLEVEEQMGLALTLPEYELRYPQTEKRFGPLSQKHRRHLVAYMNREGFLLDPVYMGKQFLDLKGRSFKTPTLVIHTGGVLSALNRESSRS